jgi:hypothetical protein
LEKRSPASMERISLVMEIVTVNVKHVKGMCLATIFILQYRLFSVVPCMFSIQ